MYRHVLVPTDFSAVSLQATKHACDLVRALGGQLTLLHVLGGDTNPEDARLHLEALRHLARRPPTLLTRNGAPEGVVSSILTCVSEQRADLIVLGASGEGGADRLGSVARELAFRASVPVHVIPAVLTRSGGTPRAWRNIVQSG
ncbi:universal stress protein [Deinococcus navajonensis]|uniref:Universal stress protein n=1 Tax=Deinococcus navajonensis TaxID=309884 RepID=A0ABV8XQA9_9DEIO